MDKIQLFALKPNKSMLQPMLLLRDLEWMINSDMIKALLAALLAGIVAIMYSELLFLGTRALYRKGLLLRYYPLPKERNAGIAFLSASSFIVPTTLFATYYQPDLQRSWHFNPVTLLLHLLIYMTIHDVYFYLVHTTLHRLRVLYTHLHAMHHEYVYAMNVYAVGYAEMLENSLQVGVPWVFWTWIAGANWWNWLLPLSLVVFTTLVGHSGYRMNPWIAIFHPLVIPVIAVSGSFMLTPGDHQVHHTHRRYNFGLFWRVMDKWHGTYRKGDVKAHDIMFWQEWTKKSKENSEQSKKWLGRHAVTFSEVEWGF